MSYAVGSPVKARCREWVVLPESEEDLLVLRPLGGTEDEVTGIYLPLETVEPASFDLPDPTKSGDYRSSRLLRDAVRLGFRYNEARDGYVVHEPEMAAVWRIFEMFGAEGASVYGVKAALDTSNVPPPRGVRGRVPS